MVHSLFLYAAATVSMVAFLAHVFIGTAKNAAPILENAALPAGPKWTMVFSWQANSILMLFMVFGFVFAAAVSGQRTLSVFMTLLAIALAVWGGVVSLRGAIMPWQFPPAVLFFVVAILGLAGSKPWQF